MMDISQKWRLEGLLQGFDIEKWKKDLEVLCKEKDLVKSILGFQELSAGFRQFSSYANCLFSENVSNPEGVKLCSKAIELETLLQKAKAIIDLKLLEIGDLDAFIKENRLEGIAFALKRSQKVAKEKMSLEKEALSTDLSLNGYHSWYELYKQLIASLRCSVDGQSYSCSQIENMLSDGDRGMRKKAFLALEEACRQHEAIFSQALRSILGFRLDLYRHRGWKNPLHDALTINHMTEKTLSTMWQKVGEALPVFHRFLDKKAELFCLEKISWYDFDAPYPNALSRFSYNDAASDIVEFFSKKCPQLGAFANKCFEERWVEAENREGKAPGGFCTPLPLSKESRVYMNYADTMHNVLVLAHELGHAYHDHVAFELPELSQHYPMSLAEAASTTCELIVLDGLIEKAKSKEEKKRLYYEKAHRHTTFFVNMLARFSFEQDAFQMISSAQFLDANTLSTMMLKAQDAAYGGRLEQYHPYFWISKVHFYITDMPSYNFPYTFGYLVSQAISRKEPSWFQSHYKRFLQDTGRMMVEELIEKYFGQNFWNESIAAATKDVEEFLAL